MEGETFFLKKNHGDVGSHMKILSSHLIQVAQITTCNIVCDEGQGAEEGSFCFR